MIYSGRGCSDRYFPRRSRVIMNNLETLNYLARDGILGHQFNKRLETFPSPIHWQILKKTKLYFKNPLKKSAKQENSNLFINSIL